MGGFGGGNSGFSPSQNIIPGSTKWGTDLTDTHQVTGSVDITGSLEVNGSAITGLAGGSDTQVQYNDAGSFAGSANLTFDGSAVSVTGSVALSGSGDNIVITSNSEAGAEIGSAHLGDWPAVNNYAFFGHNSLDHSAAGNYGFMQSAAGETFFNAASGQQLNFRINNSNKLNILSDGKVGIGVTASLALLHISGTDGTDAFRVDTLGAQDNPAIVVSGSNSYVGIGTDAPSQGLHVKDNGGGQIVSRIEGSAGRAVLQVDNGTNYTFFGASTTGLDFSVGGASDYGAQQMVLKATGRLGINVTDPDAQLEVSGTSTQQKWSYDADSFATMTVADDGHTTLASSTETVGGGNITLDAHGDLYLQADGDRLAMDAPTVEVTGTLSLNGTDLTSTAAELNLLDASTVTAPSEGIWTGVERVAVMNIGASEYAVGAHALGVTLPDNAIITRALLDITTPLTSSGGTTTLELATTGNIFPASLSLPIDFFLTLGGTVGIESFEEEMVYILTIEGGKLNGASTLTCTVAEEPVTAGSMNVYVYYVMGS